MAPEALTGQPVDARADLFAVGAILYEMLAGRPAFAGRSVVEVAHAVIHDTPALLTGSTAVAAIDRIVHRALAKQPDARYPSARAMAQALRQVLATTSDTQETMRARPVSRLVVLPFQMLRPDDDTEYLAFSLPDAITSSLSGLRSLVVRSSRAAGKFDSATPDLKALAEQAEVDLVTACRYCGLSDASVAAHEHARRLDPTVPSSVVYTLSNAGDYTAAVELATGSYNFGVRTQCLIVLGRRTEALDVLKRRETDIGSQRAPIVRLLLPLLRTLAEGGRDRDVAALEARFDMLMAVDWDPEGTFRFGLYLAQAGGLQRAVALIDRAITRGYACYPALMRDPWLDALRGRPDFGRLLKAAKTRHDEAREAFRRASGEEVLGVEV